jgi:hypothetical protein
MSEEEWARERAAVTYTRQRFARCLRRLERCRASTAPQRHGRVKVDNLKGIVNLMSPGIIGVAVQKLPVII